MPWSSDLPLTGSSSPIPDVDWANQFIRALEERRIVATIGQTPGNTWTEKLNTTLPGRFCQLASTATATSTLRDTDGAMTAGSAVLTGINAGGASATDGRKIVVVGAGPGGTDLVTRIASRQSTSSITLETAASTTVSGAVVEWGGSAAGVPNFAIPLRTSASDMNWAAFQASVEAMVPSFVDSTYATFNGYVTSPLSPGEFPRWSLATWRAAAGIPSGGFTRKYPRTITGTGLSGVAGQRAYLSSGGLGTSGCGRTVYQYNGSTWEVASDQVSGPDILTAYGFAQPGDYFGAWIPNELYHGINQLKWTRRSMGGPFNADATGGRGSGTGATAPDALADATADWNTGVLPSIVGSWSQVSYNSTGTSFSATFSLRTGRFKTDPILTISTYRPHSCDMYAWAIKPGFATADDIFNAERLNTSHLPTQAYELALVESQGSATTSIRETTADVVLSGIPPEPSVYPTVPGTSIAEGITDVRCNMLAKWDFEYAA